MPTCQCFRSALGLLFCFMALGCQSRPIQLETLPADVGFEKFAPRKAPAPGKLLLRPGDRLAIAGDSITEQRMYSRLIEDYLTVCVPELNISARQYGWSGETAEGFLRRMTNDCLRFHPTVATTCYGMNDYKYRPYDEANARWYRSNYTAVVEAFKAAGARVVLGSPGCVGKVASWVKTASGTVEEHNLHLCALRNIDVEIAARERVRFADVFWPMLTQSFVARQEYGPAYALAGKDGVHPGWAGHLVMAYAYLRAMGLDGNLGAFTLDLRRQRVRLTPGHTLVRAANGEFTITSRRYPFCATGDLNKDDSLRSGMTLVPFNQQLNRLTLVARGGHAENYKVTWGEWSRVYSAAQLARGVNLAEDFNLNPFSESFRKVDEAVAAKEAYETTQIQRILRSQAARADMAGAVARSEIEHERLAEAIRTAFAPVTYTLRVEPIPVAPPGPARFIAKLRAHQKQTIVTLGTSLTGGGWRWVDVMKDWLDSEFPGLVTVQNLGVGASASCYPPGRSGLDTVKRCAELEPDVVFVEFAVNDAYLPYHISLEASRRNLNAIVDEILRANPKAEIVVQTTNPVIDLPGARNGDGALRPRLAQYYRGYREIARERSLILIDAYPCWLKPLESGRDEFLKRVPDGVHPRAPSYREILLPELQRVLLGKVE